MTTKKVIGQVSLEEAIEKLSDRFINPEHKSVAAETDMDFGSFYEFTRDIWSQGYEYPEHFHLWHIKQLCEDVQQALDEKKHYVAVIPRGHYKSTVLGHAFTVWRLLTSERDTEVVYLSYSENMAQHYHIAEIKKYIRANPILSKIMVDRAKNSDFAFRYNIGTKRVEVIPAGVFSFKRGTHVNGALIADDLLRDPQNPLVHTQLLSIEETFFKEAIYIPNPGVPIIAMGTPMAPDDLLAKLQDDERFNKRVLPVFDPVPGVHVLAPEIRDEEWLLRESKERPNSFATEFMLAPFSTTSSYINEADLANVEKDDLNSHDPYELYFNKDDSDFIVAGLDIGRKRHPSNLVVFKCNEKVMKIRQINITFLDGWDYTKQANFINMVTKNLCIDRGYFDNTRSELEDRDLDSAWVPISFSLRSKRKMATLFEDYVINEKIELINNFRQRSQITCVDVDLKAPETPLGHGESFWANALAVLAHYEAANIKTTDIGDLGDWVRAGDYKMNTGARSKQVVDFDSVGGINQDVGYCRACGESSGWIPERQLCLICYCENEEREWNRIQMNNEYEEEGVWLPGG